jgi:hypothetical protein
MTLPPLKGLDPWQKRCFPRSSQWENELPETAPLKPKAGLNGPPATSFKEFVKQEFGQNQSFSATC